MNNNNNEELIKRLSFENWIWGIYLVIAIANIYGDELIKKAIREEDQKASEKARNIFLVILIATLLINTYFLIRNYSDLQKDPENKSLQIRFTGSILLLLATFCFIYSQIATQEPTESVSNV